MDHFTINTGLLNGLMPLQNLGYSDDEIYDEFIKRYPIAADLISEKMKVRAREIMGKLLSVDHDPKFTDIFNIAYEFLMDVEMKDSEWLFTTDVEAVILFGKLHQFEQQKFYELLRNIPLGTIPRFDVIQSLANMYRQMCEGLLTYVYSILVSFGSTLKSQSRSVLETKEWNTFNLSEYIRSLNNGKYSNLLNYYDSVVRNACAHNGISFELWDSSIEFIDKNDTRTMDGEEFCELLYDLTQTVNHIILAIEFYRSIRTENEVTVALKKMAIDKVAMLFFEEARVDQVINNSRSPLSMIKLEEIEVIDKRITFTIIGPSERGNKNEQWANLLLRLCIDNIISPMTINLEHVIETVVVKVKDRNGLMGKIKATIDKSVKDIIFFPGPNKRN